MLEDSVKVDSTQTRATLLKIMQINEKAKADKLARINSSMRESIASTKNRTTLAIILATLFVIAVFALVKLRSRKKANKDATLQPETATMPQPMQEFTATAQPVPVKKQFYDKDINELITLRVNSNKMLKPADWQLIEERLYESFPNFKDELCSHINLSETELRICMLIKMEVSPSNMAKLLALSNSSVTQIRLRLQHKVFNGQGTAKDWDNFVLSL